MSSPIQERSEEKWPRPVPIPEDELDNPTLLTVGRLIWNTLARLFHDPVAMLIGSAFVLLMLWGQHGDLELLHGIWNGWQGPGSDPATRGTIVPGIAWDQEWLSFWAGALLLVGIPLLLIKFVFRQSPRDYGLGLPPSDRRRLTLLSAGLLLAVGVPIFYLGAQDAGMQDVYPFFNDFANDREFIVYELGYLPFFLAIEFIFRGYLLFGLYGVGERTVRFGYYAILISMLSYTAWGLVAGTIVLATRTIWAIVLVHWLLNVWLDLVIYKGW